MSAVTPSKYFEIDRFSHHFVLRNMSPSGQQVAERFARNYIQYGMIKVGRFFKRGPVKVFAAKIARKNEIRFHVGQYNAFKAYLADIGIPEVCYTEQEYGYVEAAPLNCEITDEKTPFDYQVIINEYLQSPFPSWRKFVGIPPGKGKSTANNTLIKIPGGWKKMGDIEVGDYVIARDGSHTMVEGVYPQGKLQLYRITFDDGRSLECCGEHLWKVFYKEWDHPRRWRVVDTHELIRLLKLPTAANKLYIPLCEAEVGGLEVNFPIHPYLLGAILGDGGTTTGSISITKLDKELFENITPLLGDGLKLSRINHKTHHVVCDEGATTNRLVRALKELGLMGKLSYEKFIPEMYLNGNSAQRLQLLQGLMDTDGTANTLETGGAISYNSTSEQLAKDVQYLVRSLGGIASISERNTQYPYKGELKDGRTSYDVNIRYKRPSQLFTLPRKKERTNDNNQYADGLKLRIVSIEPTEIAEATCISVDHPEKLFVAKDFIVTHNTFTACWAASQYNTRIVGFLKPKYLKKWPGDLKELLGMNDKDVITVEGSAELMAVISAAKEGSLTAKAVLVSSRTFQNYINEYEEKGDHILNTGYDCLPQEFCQVIRAGVRIVDEVHEEFHCNFKIDLYTHVEKAISLSATLEADDQFITKMMETAYPPDERCQLVIRDKYVHSYALRYHIVDGPNLRTTEMGSQNYSHMAFEKNFFGNRYGWLLKAYLDLIDYRFAERWVTRMEPGQKCLIYAASIQMCTTITDYLKRKYPEFKIQRYVEKDPYENLMKSDVCVSTIGSAGTGHDIKGLITVLLTQAINAKAANIQGFGRLRKIEGVDVEFEYFTCKDIEKHMEYFMKKEMLLAERAMSCETIDLPYIVGE